MIRRVFDRLHSINITIQEWVIFFVMITFLRTFLENFSSRNGSSFFTADAQTILHYTLFYGVTTLALALIVSFWSRRPIQDTLKVTLVGLMIILTPPIADLVLSWGKGMEMAYLFEPASGLARNFLTFFGAHELPGITPGIRLELLVILTASFLYIYTYTQSVIRSLLGLISVYGILFVLLAMPSIVAWGYSEVWLYYILLARDSLFLADALHPALAPTSFQRYTEMNFNGIMSHLAYSLLVPIVGIITYRLSPRRWLAVVGNSRPERVAHYFFLIVFGAALALFLGRAYPVELSWFNVAHIAILFIAFYSAWMYSVGVNDIVDLESDRLTNANRPLVTGKLSVADVQSANRIFLLLAVVGGYLAGSYAFYFVLTFIALYYIYSVPPLHLKRFMFVNSFIISLCALTAVLAGFYLVSADDRVGAFPPSWLYLIVGVYFLLANVKDIKDGAGDRKVGVYTVVSVFGDVRGKQIVAGMVALGLALIPLATGKEELWFTAVPAALAGAYLIQKKPFVERHLFYAYFVFLIASALLLLFS